VLAEPKIFNSALFVVRQKHLKTVGALFLSSHTGKIPYRLFGSQDHNRPLHFSNEATSTPRGRPAAQAAVICSIAISGLVLKLTSSGTPVLRRRPLSFAQSWNERMWSDGEPIDPSPTIDQAVNGGFPWLEIQCARCKTPSDVDLAAIKHPPTTFVHDLASRLRVNRPDIPTPIGELSY
jgi:hypothetical protein